MAWDDAKKQKAVDLYKEGNPTAENSVELVKEIAEELGETPNGVRMILSKAEVYVKKDGTASAGKGSAEKKASTRVSKADSIQALKDVIESTGQEADEEILDKLTGKQAVYFTDVIKALVKD
jgi:predicted transcriptional regulator